MEGAIPNQSQLQPQPQQPPMAAAERLNAAVQQQLHLDSVKIRAMSLFKAISRILEDFDAYARTNATPKWQDILGQYSMVNLELFNIVEEIRKVSKAFVVHPKNVNAENSTSVYISPSHYPGVLSLRRAIHQLGISSLSVSVGPLVADLC